MISTEVINIDLNPVSWYNSFLVLVRAKKRYSLPNFTAGDFESSPFTRTINSSFFLIIRAMFGLLRRDLNQDLKRIILMTMEYRDDIIRADDASSKLKICYGILNKMGQAGLINPCKLSASSQMMFLLLSNMTKVTQADLKAAVLIKPQHQNDTRSPETYKNELVEFAERAVMLASAKYPEYFETRETA